MVVKVKESAAPFVPEERKLPVLAEAVQRCWGCDLYKNATKAVFGEVENRDGRARPKIAIMMIGEQPGDQEDKLGVLSSALRGSCWIRRWKRRRSIAARCM